MGSVEVLRLKACDFAKSDRIGHVIARTFDLITAVERDGIEAESVSDLIELLAIDRVFVMKRDNVGDKPLRELVYGIIESLGSMIENIAKKRVNGMLMTEQGSDHELPDENTVEKAEDVPTSPDPIVKEEEPDEFPEFKEEIVEVEEAGLGQSSTETVDKDDVEADDVPGTSQQDLPHDEDVKLEDVKLEDEDVVESMLMLSDQLPDANNAMPSAPLSGLEHDVKLEDGDVVEATFPENTEEKRMEAKNPPRAAFIPSDRQEKSKKAIPPSACHQCVSCSRAFNTKHGLARHMSVHEKNGKFTCDICSFSTLTHTAFEVHMNNHAEERPHKCIECSIGFKSSILLKKHLREAHGQLPFSCATCGVRFGEFSQLSIHTKTHIWNDSAVGRIRQRLGLNDDMPNKDATTRGVASKKILGATESMNDDEMTSGEEPGTSQQPAHKRSRLSDEVASHQHKNTQEGLGNSSDDLVEDDDVPQAAEFIHRCVTCYKVFGTRASLNAHADTAHKKSKKSAKFACNLCSFTGPSGASVKIHKCTHHATAKGIHKCHICKEGFLSYWLLNNHIRGVHGLLPFECVVCGMKFDGLSQFTLHKKKHFYESVSRTAYQSNT